MRIATRSPSSISIFGLENFDVTLPGVLVAPLPESTFQQILTPEAVAFLADANPRSSQEYHADPLLASLRGYPPFEALLKPDN